MREAEWRLRYPGTDFLFGTGVTPVFNRTAPDLGDVEVRTSDVSQPYSDGDLMGRDFAGGRTISFDLGVKGTPPEIRDHLGRLAAAWDARSVRQDPGSTAEIHSNYRGAHRVAYGRPRRFAASIADVSTGLGTAVAEFQTVDPYFYGADKESAVVRLTSGGAGGLLAPLAAPLATTGSSDRSTALTVTSDLPVWPVIKIAGPIINPEVELLGLWKFRLLDSLAYDQKLTIDTRPWRRGVYVTPGRKSRRGALSRDSVRLVDAAIPAGTYEIAFRGRTDSGNPEAEIRWQNAYLTP